MHTVTVSMVTFWCAGSHRWRSILSGDTKSAYRGHTIEFRIRYRGCGELKRGYRKLVLPSEWAQLVKYSPVMARPHVNPSVPSHALVGTDVDDEINLFAVPRGVTGQGAWLSDYVASARCSSWLRYRRA